MRTIHLVSHTHWDREWYLTFQQFRLKLVQLVDNLLDILASDPQYKYFMLDGQTILLEDYLEVRPEREAILRQFIQSGRITIGPWYVLPDEFLVSP
jgi:alpha-mannosidase